MALTINMTGSSTFADAAMFNAAAAVWENVIDDDLTVAIRVLTTAVDGPEGVLGSAEVHRYENSGGTVFNPRQLASFGTIRIDSADLPALAAAGKLFDLLVHEIGHIIGIGDRWDVFGLANGASYVGPEALQAYRDLIGDQTATAVPLEAYGGDGTALVHWREDVFDSEVMTGFAEESGVAEPLSILTLAALLDLGYLVDLSKAAAYIIPPPLPPEAPLALKGSKSDDLLEGGTGADRLRGKKGDDELYGNDGDDALFGGKGADYADGGFGNDQIFGGKGDDRLFGDFGDDVIFGGKGADLLDGEDGRDTLYGGKGDDVINGGTGDDQLYGGKGADTFYFGPSSGYDIIHDFKPGKDSIEIAENGFRLSPAAGFSYVDTPGGVVIYAGASVILVQGFAYAAIVDDVFFV